MRDKYAYGTYKITTFMYRQKLIAGFSLLELLLVFLIASALVFVGINQYKRLDRQREVEAIKYNVDLLRHATVLYYRKHIADFQKPDFDPATFTLQSLIDDPDHFWPSKHLVKTKLISAYAVATQNISTTSEKLYNFTATITLLVDENTAEWLKNVLSATKRDGTKLTWQYLPTYAIPTMDTGLWILNADLQQFKKATTAKQQ